jgi:prolyl oligopeptidase
MAAAPSTWSACRARTISISLSETRRARTIIDVAALRAAHGNTPYAINYFFASPDGSKVAVGISQGGSEAASIFVHDAASGKQIAGPLDRADPGELAWSEDSSRLYFPRLKKLAPGEAEGAKYNLTLFSWDLKSEPVAVLGSIVGRGPSIGLGQLPKLSISPGAPLAIAASIKRHADRAGTLASTSLPGERPAGGVDTLRYPGGWSHRGDCGR